MNPIGLGLGVAALTATLWTTHTGIAWVKSLLGARAAAEDAHAQLEVRAAQDEATIAAARTQADADLARMQQLGATLDQVGEELEETLAAHDTLKVEHAALARRAGDYLDRRPGEPDAPAAPGPTGMLPPVPPPSGEPEVDK